MLFKWQQVKYFKNNGITGNFQYTPTSKVIHARLELEVLVVAVRIIPT
jgi:hypothetical protein